MSLQPPAHWKAPPGQAAEMPGDLAAIIGPVAPPQPPTAAVADGAGSGVAAVAPAPPGPPQLHGGGLKPLQEMATPVITPHSQLWWALWRIEVIGGIVVGLSGQIMAYVHPFGSSQVEFVTSQGLSGLGLVVIALSLILNPSPPNARG